MRHLRRKTWNEVAADNGFVLLTDVIHLSDRAAAVAADLLEGWLTASNRCAQRREGSGGSRRPSSLRRTARSCPVHWLIVPKVDVEVFSMALKHFAKEVGASKERRILLLVVDQAGWHTGKEVEVPEGIHLEFLPSHSPELQPTERLWPLTKEAVANRLFESVGWIQCGVGLLLGSQGFAVAYAGYALSARPDSVPGGKIALWVSGWFDYPMLFLAAALLILLFPDGRLPDRRWRIVPWLAVGGSVLSTFRLATKPAGPFYFYPPIRTPIFEVGGALEVTVDVIGRLSLATLFLTCVASVIAVFVRLGSAQGEERQQIKWFAYAATVLLSAVFLSPAVGSMLAAIGVPWGVAIAIPIVLGLLAIPVAVGVAILRYRLYEIDRIINRTLVYGALTVVLIGVYFGGIVVLQRTFVALTGQKSTLAVVASTLLIAALFNPLRHSTQSFIDRRFYRSKYDARRTLEAFSIRLRDETDLEALRDELVGVVRETMQPAYVSMWLRPDPQLRGSKSLE